ncbi:uncharacterized protein [Miscanthus floridulus]|uniref:uncharacterized protein n=1 Tax=Miscanthus floridulus TaxID=154761 RepID=UPI00345995B9
MFASTLFDEEILRRVRETLEVKLRRGGLTPITMHPSWGFLSLGMRDVRASPPPVPEDAARRAANRAHAEAQKKRKDAEQAKCKRKTLERDELEKHHHRQRQEGLPVEASPSSSLSVDSLGGDDASELGRGPLDHLPDVGETVPGASTSGPTLLGGGGGDASGPAVARPRAEADMPKARALGKRAVSPVGSTAEVEQVAGGGNATATAFAEEGHRAEAVAAPFKALKVSPSSTAHWVVEAQAAIQRGAASARADPKEPVAQGEAAEVASTQTGEGAPLPREAEAHGSDGSKAPLVAEATEVEAPRASKAEAMEAAVPRTTEATVAGAGAPGTTEAVVAEADMSAAKPAA